MIIEATKKIIDVKVFSKICATCMCVDRRVEEVVDHASTNHYYGRSKCMEASEGLYLTNELKLRWEIVA